MEIERKKLEEWKRKKYKVLKAAGLTRSKQTEADKETEQSAILTPQIVRYAQRRKPRITRFTLKGTSYKDVTDIYLPW